VCDSKTRLKKDIRDISRVKGEEEREMEIGKGRERERESVCDWVNTVDERTPIPNKCRRDEESIKCGRG